MNDDPHFRDLLGREYARLSNLKVGDTIETDGGFECLGDDPTTGKPRRLLPVIDCGDGVLGFACSEGTHALDGQLMDDGDHLVGIYPVDMTPRGAAS